MDKKEIIVVETWWKKVCNFFSKLFFRKNIVEDEEINIEIPNVNTVSKINNERDAFLKSIDYRDATEELSRKRSLAEKLMDGKIGVNDLSDETVDEMIIYFKKYISEIDTKINRIKNSNGV